MENSIQGWKIPIPGMKNPGMGWKIQSKDGKSNSRIKNSTPGWKFQFQDGNSNSKDGKSNPRDGKSQKNPTWNRREFGKREQLEFYLHLGDLRGDFHHFLLLDPGKVWESLGKLRAAPEAAPSGIWDLGIFHGIWRPGWIPEGAGKAQRGILGMFWSTEKSPGIPSGMGWLQRIPGKRWECSQKIRDWE